jgi:hypothetical protein
LTFKGGSICLNKITINNYEKLRQLLCEEEEIRNDLLELRETTEE